MNHQSSIQASILIVDDEAQIRRLLGHTLVHEGYTCFEASNGKEALEILDGKHIDVVITDISMPEMDGITLTEKIRAQSDQDVIMMTGHTKDLTYGDAIAKGSSDFFQKPFNLKEVLIRLNRVLMERYMRFKLKETLRQSRQILDGLVQALSSTVEARDYYTSGHQKRVAKLACEIAHQMDLSKDRITGIRMAGVIHDLGKIAIPSEILSKPRRLSTIEYELLKTHPQVGYDILKNIDFHMPIARIVYQHHERIDGSGYPEGISGNDILIESRIMAVADVVEAMSSHRPYRPSLGIHAAIEEITKNKGIIFDPFVVNACLKVIGEEGFEFES